MKAIVVIAIVFLAICSGNSVYNLRFDELLRAPGDTSHKLQGFEKRHKVESVCMDYTFGCCPDNKTPKHGSHNEGCGVKLCMDESVSQCKRISKTDCNDEAIYKKCHRRCNPQCRQSVNPKRCNSPYGCCWDGSPKLSPSDKCRECSDDPDVAILCQRFNENDCQEGGYGVTSFLEKRCHKTCKKCF